MHAPVDPVCWIRERFVLLEGIEGSCRSRWLDGRAPFKELGADVILMLESFEGCAVDVGGIGGRSWCWCWLWRGGP